MNEQLLADVICQLTTRTVHPVVKVRHFDPKTHRLMRDILAVDGLLMEDASVTGITGTGLNSGRRITVDMIHLYGIKLQTS